MGKTGKGGGTDGRLQIRRSTIKEKNGRRCEEGNHPRERKRRKKKNKKKQTQTPADSDRLRKNYASIGNGVQQTAPTKKGISCGAEGKRAEATLSKGTTGL